MFRNHAHASIDSYPSSTRSDDDRHWDNSHRPDLFRRRVSKETSKLRLLREFKSKNRILSASKWPCSCLTRSINDSMQVSQSMSKTMHGRRMQLLVLDMIGIDSWSRVIHSLYLVAGCYGKHGHDCDWFNSHTLYPIFNKSVRGNNCRWQSFDHSRLRTSSCFAWSVWKNMESFSSSNNRYRDRMFSVYMWYPLVASTSMGVFAEPHASLRQRRDRFRVMLHSLASMKNTRDKERIFRTCVWLTEAFPSMSLRRIDGRNSMMTGCSFNHWIARDSIVYKERFSFYSTACFVGCHDRVDGWVAPGALICPLSTFCPDCRRNKPRKSLRNFLEQAA
jgi:hypothetical protein